MQGSDDSDVIIPQIVDIQELTDDEQQERLRLERLVERAFYSAGSALAQLRQQRLYRSTHGTFEDYCQDRFSFTRRHVNYLISAAAVVDNLKMGTIGSQNLEEREMLTNGWQNSEEGKMGTIGSQNDYYLELDSELILPTTERQCRPLSALEPSEQLSAWSESVSQAGGKVPPARLVAEVVAKMQQHSTVSNPWRVGEVAQIVIKGNPDLKGKAGCWAVIIAVNDFSCSVQLWNGEYQVKLENLKELPYSNQQQEVVRKLCARISRIKLDEVEQPARDFLAGLGRLNRPWLTEIEESILGVLETQMKQ
ncbi:MAG: hypothetical protein AB4062_13890 [Crocosphaera sp.]